MSMGLPSDVWTRSVHLYSEIAQVRQPRPPPPPPPPPQLTVPASFFCAQHEKRPSYYGKRFVMASRPGGHQSPRSGTQKIDIGHFSGKQEEQRFHRPPPYPAQITAPSPRLSTDVAPMPPPTEDWRSPPYSPRHCPSPRSTWQRCGPKHPHPPPTHSPAFMHQPPPPPACPLAERAPRTSHWRDCHFADALSPSLLKHLLKGEGGGQQNDSLADGYPTHAQPPDAAADPSLAVAAVDCDVDTAVAEPCAGRDERRSRLRRPRSGADEQGQAAFGGWPIVYRHGGRRAQACRHSRHKTR